MSWQLIPASRFGEYAERWNELNRRTTDTPFFDSAFIQPLLREFGTGRELLALHSAGGRLTAASLLMRVGRGMWQTFQPSQLPLGPWLCSADADLLQLTRALVRRLPGLALGVGITQLDPRLLPRPADGATLSTLDYVSTSHVEVAADFNAYWESRGKNLRQNTRKQRNKLATEGIEPSLECVERPVDVLAAIADYGALESAGWKSGTGTAIHPQNEQGRFYIAALEAFCAQGRGRIYRYRFGEKVVAMDLCVDSGPVVVILKTTYDESYRAVSPSTLMRQEQFRAWWDEGRYRRVEFYGKTLEWHTRWTESHRMLYHVNSYRWPWVRKLARRAARGESAQPPESTAT